MLFLLFGVLIHFGVYYLGLWLGLKGAYWRRFLRYAGLGGMWLFGILTLLSLASFFVGTGDWALMMPGLCLLVALAIGWPLWRAYRRFLPRKEEEDATQYY